MLTNDNVQLFHVYSLSIVFGALCLFKWVHCAYLNRHIVHMLMGTLCFFKCYIVVKWVHCS